MADFMLAFYTRQNRETSNARHIERFQAKWIPVRVKKTFQIRNLEIFQVSTKPEKALVPPRDKFNMSCDENQHAGQTGKYCVRQAEFIVPGSALAAFFLGRLARRIARVPASFLLSLKAGQPRGCLGFQFGHDSLVFGGAKRGSFLVFDFSQPRSFRLARSLGRQFGVPRAPFRFALRFALGAGL